MNPTCSCRQTGPALRGPGICDATLSEVRRLVETELTGSCRPAWVALLPGLLDELRERREDCQQNRAEFDALFPDARDEGETYSSAIFRLLRSYKESQEVERDLLETADKMGFDLRHSDDGELDAGAIEEALHELKHRRKDGQGDERAVASFLLENFPNEWLSSRSYDESLLHLLKRLVKLEEGAKLANNILTDSLSSSNPE